jgi:hypothetical protein
MKQTDRIVERTRMGIQETRAFMRMMEGGKPQPIEVTGCKICGCQETGHSEKYDITYCKECLTEIN